MSRRRIWFRRLARLALAVILAAAIFLLLTPWILPALVQGRILAALASANLPKPSLHVESVTPWRTHLSNLTLGAPAGLVVGSVTADYSIASLRQGKVRQIDIVGLDYVVHIGPGGVDLGPLANLATARDKPSAPRRDAGPSELPFDAATLRAATLTLDLAGHRVALPLQGQIQRDGRDLAFDLTLDLPGQRVIAKGRYSPGHAATPATPPSAPQVRATVNVGSMPFDLAVDLGPHPRLAIEGHFTQPTLDLARLPFRAQGLDLNVTWPLGEPSSVDPSLEPDIRLRLRQASLGGSDPVDLDATAQRLPDGAWTASLRAFAPSWALRHFMLHTEPASPDAPGGAASILADLSGRPPEPLLDLLRRAGVDWRDAGEVRLAAKGRARLPGPPDHSQGPSTPWSLDIPSLRVELADAPGSPGSRGSSLTVGETHIERPRATLQFRGHVTPDRAWFEVEPESLLQASAVRWPGGSLVPTADEGGRLIANTTPLSASGPAISAATAPARAGAAPTASAPSAMKPTPNALAPHSLRLRLAPRDAGQRPPRLVLDRAIVDRQPSRWRLGVEARALLEQPVSLTTPGLAASVDHLTVALDARDALGTQPAMEGRLMLRLADLHADAAGLTLVDAQADLPWSWPAPTSPSPPSTAPSTAAAQASPSAAPLPRTPFAPIFPAPPADAGSLRVARVEVAGRLLGPVRGRLRAQGSTLHAWAEAPLVEDGRVHAWAAIDLARGGRWGQLAGRAAASVPPFSLKNPATLGQLIPSAEGLDITGQIHASATFDIEPDRVTPRIDLRLADIAIIDAVSDVEIRGASADLALESLRPLATTGGQRLRVGEARLGKTQLRDAEVLFRLESPRSLLVERLSCGFAKPGLIQATAFRLDPWRPRAEMSLFLQDVELQEFVETLSSGRVVGEGSVYGQLVLRLDPAKTIPIEIGQGFLYSRSGKGWFQIKDQAMLDTALSGLGGDGSGKASDLTPVKEKANQALRDFAYSALRIELRREEGELICQIRIAGRGRQGVDPLVFEGLNINIYEFNRFVNATTKVIDKFTRFFSRMGRVIRATGEEPPAGESPDLNSTVAPDPTTAPSTVPSERAAP